MTTVVTWFDVWVKDWFQIFNPSWLISPISTCDYWDASAIDGVLLCERRLCSHVSFILLVSKPPANNTWLRYLQQLPTAQFRFSVLLTLKFSPSVSGPKREMYARSLAFSPHSQIKLILIIIVTVIVTLPTSPLKFPHVPPLALRTGAASLALVNSSALLPFHRSLIWD